MSWLKKIDITAPEVKLNVQGLESYKSKSGGILSLLLGILTILAFIAFGRDIIEKKNPNVQLNIKDNPDRKYNYNSNEFTIMFAVTDNKDFSPILEVERKMNLYFNVRNTNASNVSNDTTGSNLIDLNIPLIPCTLEKSDPDVLPNMIVDISNYWCVPPNVNYDLINGLGEGTAQWFRIQMEICKNTTENNNLCYPADVIYKELSVINVHYILSDNFIDSFDYNSPGKKTFISGFLKGGANTWTRTVYWYKNIFFDTDTNWILQNFNKQTYFQNNQLDKEIYYQEKTKVFFSHLISITKKGDYFNRSYLKIQGVFAYIGGFITFFRILFSYINHMIIQQDILSIFDRNYNKRLTRSQSMVYNLHDSSFMINVKSNDKSILEKSDMSRIINIKHPPDIKTEKKLKTQLGKVKKINFFLYILPCLMKKNSESRKNFDHTQIIKEIYINIFSLEKLVKTIKNVKIIKDSLKDEKKGTIKKEPLLKLNLKRDEENK